MYACITIFSCLHPTAESRTKFWVGFLAWWICLPGVCAHVNVCAVVFRGKKGASVFGVAILPLAVSEAEAVRERGQSVCVVVVRRLIWR